jgi:hypothetical protein
LYSAFGQSPGNFKDPYGLDLELSDVFGIAWDYTKNNVADLGELALNVVTVGGYGGVKKASKKGELEQGGLSGGKAYLLGMADFLSFGSYGTTVDVMGEGGTAGQAAGTWAQNVSGVSDYRAAWEQCKEGEYLECFATTSGGISKTAGLILAGKLGYAKLTGKPVTAFGNTLVKAKVAPESGISPGAQLRAKYGKQYTEYARYRSQGYTPPQSNYLTKPYAKTGQHFVYNSTLKNRGFVARWFKDSPLNLYSGKNMSIGRFYEYHARLHVMPKFNIGSAGHTWAFPKSVGGGFWRYSNVANAPLPWGSMGYIVHGNPLAGWIRGAFQ